MNAHVNELMAAILRTHLVEPRSHVPIAMCGACFGACFEEHGDPCLQCGGRGWVEVDEATLSPEAALRAQVEG